MQELTTLIAHEFQKEWKNKNAISGVLVYVIATVFVCYLSFKRIVDVPTWNALFWIIMLFASINAVAKSFMQENEGRWLYYYTLANPRSIILSKIIYNTLLLVGVGVVCLVVYSGLVGSLVQDFPLLLITVIIGASGFAGTFTLMSAIAAKANSNASMMAILSFPIILPFLITLIQLSKNAIDGLAWSVSYSEIGILLLLDIIVIALSLLLFPYLWRD